MTTHEVLKITRVELISNRFSNASQSFSPLGKSKTTRLKYNILSVFIFVYFSFSTKKRRQFVPMIKK